MRVIRDADLLWTLVGDRSRILCGLYASTEHLTVGKMSLQPGQKSDVQHHDGDESLYVLDGTKLVSCNRAMAALGVDAGFIGAAATIFRRQAEDL